MAKESTKEEIKRKAKGEGIGLDVGSYKDEMEKLLI